MSYEQWVAGSEEKAHGSLLTAHSSLLGLRCNLVR